MKIPMVDLVHQYQGIRKEMDMAIKNVLESGYFIMGPEVETFEQELADFCHVKYGIGCASGTEALQIALMAIGIGAGDEVITTPFTFVATVEVIVLFGARPVFVDIDKTTFCIDVSQIEKAVTEKTKAIIPVHLYGQAADMDPINTVAKKHHLTVIEDAAQAVGATYNNKPICGLGDMGCLSFFPSKNLGAYGDGGMVLTSDEEYAKQLRIIRNHGSAKRYHHTFLGLNSRLDAIQAAILRVKLKHLEAWNDARKDRAALYSELLSNSSVITPVTADSNGHVFHQYTLLVDDRDGLRDHLEKAGVATAVHYPIPLHLQPAYQNLGYKKGDFPIAEDLSEKVISLPMYPELKEEDIHYITNKIIEYTKS
jgi:dTDP-4-amino-4,6-dideoxygalactose transaminase